VGAGCPAFVGGWSCAAALGGNGTRVGPGDWGLGWRRDGGSGTRMDNVDVINAIYRWEMCLLLRFYCAVKTTG